MPNRVALSEYRNVFNGSLWVERATRHINDVRVIFGEGMGHWILGAVLHGPRAEYFVCYIDGSYSCRAAIKCRADIIDKINLIISKGCAGAVYLHVIVEIP